MIKKPILGVDHDEVLGPHVEPFLVFVSERYGVHVRPEEVRTYNLSTHLGIPPETVRRWFLEFYQSPVFDNIPPDPEAQRATVDLSAVWNIVDVTSRPEAWHDKTSRWLNSHFPHINGPYYSANGHNFQESPKKPKVEVCRDLGASVLVDDCPAYLQGCANADIKGVLITRPWNQDDNEPEGVLRVNNWTEAAKYIKSLNGRH